MNKVQSAEDMQYLLHDVLHELAGDDESRFSELLNARVSTFDEAGLMSRNKGVVIRLADGAEYQITIVRSQ